MKFLIIVLLSLPVVGLAQQKKEQITIKKQNIETPVTVKNQGTKTITGEDPLLIVNGYVIDRTVLKNLNPASITSINVVKGTDALEKFGQKGKNGVMQIFVKQEAIKALVEQGAIKLTL